jgi:hypothetical protein
MKAKAVQRRGKDKNDIMIRQWLTKQRPLY